MPKNSNSFSRLRSVLQASSKREKGVVHFITKHPEALIQSTLAKVSAQCGVSETTVLRVCHRAGFEGFSDLKISIHRPGFIFAHFRDRR
jgi:DNA-binding MurR/RpiR family transcriptional regulator